MSSAPELRVRFIGLGDPSRAGLRKRCHGERPECFGGNRTRSRRRPPAPHGDSQVLRSRIGGAPAEIATEFRSAILRKTTVGAKANTEMIRWRLMFDAVVPDRLPHSVQSSVRAYNGQGSPPTP
jgi:hypothetical protein